MTQLKLYINKVLSVLILILISCNNHTEIKLCQSEIDEIKQLKTDSERSRYLTQLFRYDQELRNDDGFNILNKYGKDSEEYKEYRRMFSIKDNENFLKLKTYLQEYGYPENPDDYDKVGINGIPYIIGHTGNVDLQMEVFPILHEAYKNGMCPIDDIVWVLSEMYESEHGELYKMKTDRFTVEQEYMELIIANDLNKI